MRRQRDSQNSATSNPEPPRGPQQGVSPSSTESSARERPRTRLAQARADIGQREAPYFVSSMSLPDFRRQRSRLSIRFPCKSQHEVALNDTVDSTGLGLQYNHEIWSATQKNKVFVEHFDVIGFEFEHKEPLAVKVTTETNPDAVARANDEVRTLDQIDHNHIIAVVGSYRKTIWKERYQLCVILFPLAQYSLENYMSNIVCQPSEQDKPKFRRETSKLLSFFACLCNAVGYLHSRSQPIKHRDIKPSNVLIDGTGVVMLADFDTSKMYASQNEAITSGYTASTRLYAPGPVLREEERGFEWDVNSLGFLFLEMATIIFGKTLMELHEKLSEKIKEHNSKSVPGGQSTGFAWALEAGFLDTWIDDLKGISRTNPSWLPHSLKKSATGPVGSQYAVVDEFFKTIMAMMQASIKSSTQVLKDAWIFFAKLGEECPHCCTLGELDRLLLLNPQHSVDASISTTPPNPIDPFLQVGPPHSTDPEASRPRFMVTPPPVITDPPLTVHRGNQPLIVHHPPLGQTVLNAPTYRRPTPEHPLSRLVDVPPALSEVSSVFEDSSTASPRIEPSHGRLRLHETMGNEVIFYDPARGICDVRPLDQIRGEPKSKTRPPNPSVLMQIKDTPGELIDLPRLAWAWHNVESSVGQLNLWDMLRTARRKTYWKRTKGSVTKLFVCGDFP